jgi:hypothetical protein
MTGVVVKTVEELKAVKNNRAYPTIVIEGELASNLLASGIIASYAHMQDQPWGGPRLSRQLKPGPIDAVIEVLNDLSRWNRFEVMQCASGPKIKIYPVLAPRRESN